MQSHGRHAADARLHAPVRERGQPVRRGQRRTTSSSTAPTSTPTQQRHLRRPGRRATRRPGRRAAIDGAFAAFAAAGLTQPTIFEFPHYAGSARRLPGGQRDVRHPLRPGAVLPGRAARRHDRQHADLSASSSRTRSATSTARRRAGEHRQHRAGAVQQPPGRGCRPTSSPRRELNLVVRDGVASFFYHPYLRHRATCRQTVEGIQGRATRSSPPRRCNTW